MARKAIVTIDGTKEVKRALREMRGNIDDAVRAAIQDGAEAVRDGWHRRIPKDTGRAAQGLGITYGKDGTAAEVGERQADRKHVVEFLESGTSSMPARPSATPAAEQERRELPKRLERELAKRLEKK